VRRTACPVASCARGRLFDRGGFAIDEILDHSEIYVTLPGQPGTFASDIDGGAATTWTHVAVTFAPGALRIYKNGKLRRVHLPQGLAFPPLEVNAQPLRFGAGGGGGQPFPGDLDRVRLYGRPLSADEIAAHARKQFEACSSVGRCVGEWAFEDAQGAVVPGAGGAQLPARLVGNAQLGDGVDGMGARLAGGWVEVANDPALALRDGFTYSVWVRRMGACPPDFAGRCADERLIDKGSWFVYELHEGGSRAAINGKMFYCNSNPAAGVWTHVALAYDATGLRCYTNGRLVRSWVPGQPDNFCSSCNGP